MKGLSKREAINGVRSRLAGTNKKPFTAKPRSSAQTMTNSKTIRFHNGVQFTLPMSFRV